MRIGAEQHRRARELLGDPAKRVGFTAEDMFIDGYFSQRIRRGERPDYSLKPAKPRIRVKAGREVVGGGGGVEPPAVSRATEPASSDTKEL